MFRLESNRLRREFKVNEGYLYASRIRNTMSEMDLVPDGNSTEFTFRFADGTEFSSKGLKVTDSNERDGKLSFTFEEFEGVTVTMTYWVGADGNTLKKQISFMQTGDKIIDYILLEHVGIINSQTHFSVPDMEDMQIKGCYACLGQPFYIDSLFFGCEFPATDNRILYGVGQVKYYLGKAIKGRYACPVTVMGGAASNSMSDVQSAFFEYIDFISVKSDFRVQYNSWYDNMLNIDADNIEKSFFEIEKGLSSHGVPPLDAYVIDDGWNNYKAGFWSFNKKFPNELYDATSICKKLASNLGLWLGPRGGYNAATPKFAKKIEKSGNGFYNADSDDICIGSETYIKKVQDFLIKTTKEFDISYWKFDGFALKPCTNSKHDHITGGENEMYYITELWTRWIELFKNLRACRENMGKDLWINMTSYVNPSPWWLQYVNSVWLQNSSDIDFSDNIENQSQLDAEMTYRDSRYYDFLCNRAFQFPTKNIYNHEPIYGNSAKLDYTDEEFEKFLFFNACRGQAFNELYLSYSLMNTTKWRTLARVLRWQKENFHILKNAMFLGGKPDENNIYAYTAWTKDGEGIIALRNPTDEKTSLTLTLNKLMGCPENMRAVKRYNVYNITGAETFDLFSYGDKINLSLAPFEVKIFQFGDKDTRVSSMPEVTDFTISFRYNGEENIDICENDDIKISIEKGVVRIKCGNCHLRSASIIHGDTHKITLVRSKNRMLKLYIDSYLDASGFDERAKNIINTEITSDAPEFTVVSKAIPYDEIISLKEILSSRKRFRKK